MKAELSDFLKPVIGIFDADERAKLEQREAREQLAEGDITFNEFLSTCLGNGAYIALVTAYNVGLAALVYVGVQQIR